MLKWMKCLFMALAALVVCHSVQEEDYDGRLLAVEDRFFGHAMVNLFPSTTPQAAAAKVVTDQKEATLKETASRVVKKDTAAMTILQVRKMAGDMLKKAVDQKIILPTLYKPLDTDTDLSESSESASESHINWGAPPAGTMIPEKKINYSVDRPDDAKDSPLLAESNLLQAPPEPPILPPAIPELGSIDNPIGATWDYGQGPGKPYNPTEWEKAEAVRLGELKAESMVVKHAIKTPNPEPAKRSLKKALLAAKKKRAVLKAAEKKYSALRTAEKRLASLAADEERLGSSNEVLEDAINVTPAPKSNP